jgi:integrase
MELSVEAFLDSVTNAHTKKEYRYGVKGFCDWFGKSAEEILRTRQEDLTPKEGEGFVERRFRAARFEREIEKFHDYVLKQGKSINTARTATLGIRQLFRFYQMPLLIRKGTRVTKTVKTTKSFPLTIERVRAMFKVADLRERVMLSMATDLALRMSDFIKLKKSDLPDLNQEPPLSLEIMTNKEDVIAYAFLSAETVELLKSYMVHLSQRENDRRQRAEREGKKHRENPYLFPSNGAKPITEERVNGLLKILAEKAEITTNGKSLTFHCFRKMFLSASIDSGIGLTAGKKLIGKAIPQSDDTYLTTVQLKPKFIQLKKFLTIKQTPEPENQEKIESLKNAVAKLHEGLTQEQTITQAVTEKNIKLAEELGKLERQFAETQLALSLIQKVLTPEMLTKLQLEQLHKEYGEKHKQKPSE